MIYAKFKGIAKFWDLRNWNGFKYYEEIFPETEFIRFGIHIFTFKSELIYVFVTNENVEIIKHFYVKYNTITIGRNDVH